MVTRGWWTRGVVVAPAAWTLLRDTTTVRGQLGVGAGKGLGVEASSDRAGHAPQRLASPRYIAQTEPFGAGATEGPIYSSIEVGSEELRTFHRPCSQHGLEPLATLYAHMAPGRPEHGRAMAVPGGCGDVVGHPCLCSPTSLTPKGKNWGKRCKRPC